MNRPVDFSLADQPCAAFAGGDPLVVAQLGQSLDGRIATVSGASKYISGEEALKHLHRLRAGVDAVMIGVGTLIADDPALTVRHVNGRNPARVVIDPAGRAPRESAMFRDGASEVVVLNAPDAAAPEGARRLELVPGEDGRFPPQEIVARLRAEGYRRILVEGGADTLAGFLDAGAVEILHVLVAPMIIGSGKAGFSLAPIDRLEQAIRPRTAVHLFDDGDVLFTCDLRERGAACSDLAAE